MDSERATRGNETAKPIPKASASGASPGRVQMRRALRGKSYDEQVQLLAVPDGADDGGGGEAPPPAVPENFALAPLRTPDPAANMVEDGAATGAKGGGAAAGGAPKVANDPGELTLGSRYSMPNTLALPGGFGGMSPSFDFENIKVVHNPGEPWRVSADLHVICAWAVSDNGRTNITGPHDPKIVRNNYRSVADDLDPALDKDGPWGKTTRESYWSRFWTAEHEWFHARDTYNWAKSEGIALAKAHFAAATITSAKDVETQLEECRKKLERGWKDWFGFWEASEAAKPGEQRAYGAYAKNYEALAKEIRARADDLP